MSDAMSDDAMSEMEAIREHSEVSAHLFKGISWSIDNPVDTAEIFDTEPEYLKNTILPSVAFDGAKSISLPPNRYCLGAGSPTIHIPTGATVLEVLTAIADEYQKRPMTEEELEMEDGVGLDSTWEKAWRAYVQCENVYRIDIMGCAVAFEGFLTTEEPDVIQLCLGS